MTFLLASHLDDLLVNFKQSSLFTEAGDLAVLIKTWAKNTREEIKKSLPHWYLQVTARHDVAMSYLSLIWAICNKSYMTYTYIYVYTT